MVSKIARVAENYQPVKMTNIALREKFLLSEKDFNHHSLNGLTIPEIFGDHFGALCRRSTRNNESIPE
jgi:hypothetical protein